MPGLIAHLRASGVLRSPAIVRALEGTDRADFVPENLKSLAYEDIPLPVGGGQTISQPYTVVFMLEKLGARPGDTVLDVGYGSGWQAALLAHLVGPRGQLYGCEVVPELCAQGRKNLGKYPALARRAQLLCRSARDGYAGGAPFDRIIAAAEVAEVPSPWREQLAPGGRMIYPKGGALVLETKNQDGSFADEEFPGFVFVPFVER